MRKRIMCLILSLCMVAGVVTGCGSSEDALSDNVSVTKKLEEEYVERMEAYLAYYQEQDTDNIVAWITIDNEHLPLMWLGHYPENADSSEDMSLMQLIGYEDGEVKILAERANTYMQPVYSDYAAMACLEDEESYLIYDESVKDFRYKTETELIESEGLDVLQDLIYTEYFGYINEKNNETAYLGYLTANFDNYSDKEELPEWYELPWTFYDYNNNKIGVGECGGNLENVLRISTAEGEVALRYTEAEGDAGITTCGIDEALGLNSEYAEIYMRYLIKRPAYTNGELSTIRFSIVYGFTVIDSDIFDIALKEEEDFDLSSVETESVEDTNNNEDVNNENTDWLSAYMDYVENGNFDSDAYSGYSFIYLDNDEIPELVIHGNYEAAGNIICSYYNGLISELQTARLGFSYLEKQGLLCNSDGNMGCYYDIVYSLENGEFTKLAEGNYGDDGDFWNGEQVTANDYHSALAQVYNEENAIYDSENYSSISEAYENIDTTTSKSDDSISSTEIPNDADSSVGVDIPDGTKPAFDDNTISSESWYYICGYHDDEDPYPFITQELIDTQEDKVATYPSELYHSTSRELEYKDGILTIKYNNSSYKFQIYFTDDGELISDIVYIE